MKVPFRKWMNSFLYFCRSDRNGIIFLSGLLLMVIAINEVVKRYHPPSEYDYAALAKQMDEWEEKNASETEILSQSLFSFDPNTIATDELELLDIPGFVKQNLIKYREAGGKFKNASQFRKLYGMNDSIFEAVKSYIQIAPDEPAREYYNMKNPEKTTAKHHFDPNNAGMDTLLSYGFNRIQAANLLKYRENGGKFEQKNDLLKIYGIDSLFLAAIEKYIKIETVQPDAANNSTVLIELNTSDSTLLTVLDGVGPVFAGRIIKYRELLGGFYSKKQLLEVYNFPEETFRKIENRVYADTTLIRKIRINFAGYRELIRHPYINNELANQIIRYRNQNGPVRNIDGMQCIDTLGIAEKRRLLPYLTCR